MTGLELVARAAACLGDDLDAALDQPPALPASLEGLERQILQHAADALAGLDDVREVRRLWARRP